LKNAPLAKKELKTKQKKFASFNINCTTQKNKNSTRFTMTIHKRHYARSELFFGGLSCSSKGISMIFGNAIGVERGKLHLATHRQSKQ
jgi:hypothetical protein